MGLLIWNNQSEVPLFEAVEIHVLIPTVFQSELQAYVQIAITF